MATKKIGRRCIKAKHNTLEDIYGTCEWGKSDVTPVPKYKIADTTHCARFFDCDCDGNRAVCDDMKRIDCRSQKESSAVICRLCGEPVIDCSGHGDGERKAQSRVSKHTYTDDHAINAFLDECFQTMKSKGHDYRQGDDTDILHNFRTVASAVDTDMMRVWYTYFFKHYAALVTYIKEGGQSESEPITGRVKDMIVYLLLFYKILDEAKQKIEEF